jgi:hypothetical protein
MAHYRKAVAAAAALNSGISPPKLLPVIRREVWP